jgi:hypothetical protein
MRTRRVELRIWDCGFRKASGPRHELRGALYKQRESGHAARASHASAGRALPADLDHGRDAHATVYRCGDQRSQEGKCAKQTQFWPRQGEGQVVSGKGVMVHRTCNRLRKNKANLEA